MTNMETVKKLLKDNKAMGWVTLLLRGSFILYIIVVLGVTLARAQYGFTVMQLTPFSSYKQAWFSASYTEWRNLILNIMMFIPLGIYLPLIFRKFNKAYIVYITGFLMSVAIEFTQLFFKLGICEIDDVFNNTLGTIIGYGFYILLMFIVCGAKKKRGQEVERVLIRKVLTYQIPLLATILCFSSLFYIYQSQEFGNLIYQSNYDIKMKEVGVVSYVELTDNPVEANVYQLTIYTEDELESKADEILAYFNTEIDEEQTIVYEDTVVFRSVDGEYSLWLYKKGAGYWLTNFGVYNDSINMNLNEENVKEILASIGVVIPEQVECEILYSEEDNGGVLFTADDLEVEGVLISGTLSCDITTDGIIKSMNHYMYEYEFVTSCNIYSKQEIYEQICRGEFTLYGVKELENAELVVDEMELTYSVDSKGFFQPIYEVEILLDGEKRIIFMPAMI